MSMEEELAKNTAVMIGLTEVITRQNAIMGAAAEKVLGKAAAAATPAATATAAAEPEKKKPGRPAGSTNKPAATAAAATPATAESARTTAGAWIKEGGEAGSPEYESRKATITKLNAKHGVSKISELSAEQAGPYCDDLAALGRGEDVFEAAATTDEMDDI